MTERPVQTRSRSGFVPEGLDLAIMKQLVGSLCKRHAVVSRLRPLVNERFQVLFHSPLGVLPTFPSRYWSTIGLPVIFSLAAWSPQIQTGFHVSRPTQVVISTLSRYLYGPFTLFGWTFQTIPVHC